MNQSGVELAEKITGLVFQAASFARPPGGSVSAGPTQESVLTRARHKAAEDFASIWEDNARDRIEGLVGNEVRRWMKRERDRARWVQRGILAGTLVLGALGGFVTAWLTI